MQKNDLLTQAINTLSTPIQTQDKIFFKIFAVLWVSVPSGGFLTE